jgi:hypothetical protein
MLLCMVYKKGQRLIETLLVELCVELGICLPPEAQARMRQMPTNDVDAFARAVMEAEGFLEPYDPIMLSDVGHRLTRHLERKQSRADPGGQETVWFSGMCKRLCIIEGVGAVTEEQSVYVFRAPDDRAAAIRRFLELAQSQDQEFFNVDGQRVRWVVTALDTIDDLEEGPLGDREVHSKMREIEPPDASVSIDQVFAPEESEPGFSGV